MRSTCHDFWEVTEDLLRQVDAIQNTLHDIEARASGPFMTMRTADYERIQNAIWRIEATLQEAHE